MLKKKLAVLIAIAASGFLVDCGRSGVGCKVCWLTAQAIMTSQLQQLDQCADCHETGHDAGASTTSATTLSNNEPRSILAIKDVQRTFVLYHSEATNTDYPMTAVIDQLHQAEQPKLVIAYIDIGRAEDFRTYWQPSWGIGNLKWIITGDPDGWEGNFSVAYWYKEYQDIWLGKNGYLQAILDASFDSIYLDWVEAYSDEEFIVIGQNAAELAQDDDYADTIDTIAQEQVWFDGGANNEPPRDCPLPHTDVEVDTEAYYNSFSSPCQRQYDEFPESTLHVSSQEYLRDLQLGHSKRLIIFTVDYALDPENVAWVVATSRGLGFVPFVDGWVLDRFVEPMP